MKFWDIQDMGMTRAFGISFGVEPGEFCGIALMLWKWEVAIGVIKDD